MLIDALCVLCAQLTRDLFAIAKFLLYLRQARLAGEALYSALNLSIRSSVRSLSVTKLLNAIF